MLSHRLVGCALAVTTAASALGIATAATPASADPAPRPSPSSAAPASAGTEDLVSGTVTLRLPGYPSDKYGILPSSVGAGRELPYGQGPRSIDWTVPRVGTVAHVYLPGGLCLQAAADGTLTAEPCADVDAQRFTLEQIGPASQGLRTAARSGDDWVAFGSSGTLRLGEQGRIASIATRSYQDAVAPLEPPTDGIGPVSGVPSTEDRITGTLRIQPPGDHDWYGVRASRVEQGRQLPYGDASRTVDWVVPREGTTGHVTLTGGLCLQAGADGSLTAEPCADVAAQRFTTERVSPAFLALRPAARSGDEWVAFSPSGSLDIGPTRYIAKFSDLHYEAYDDSATADVAAAAGPATVPAVPGTPTASDAPTAPEPSASASASASAEPVAAPSAPATTAPATPSNEVPTEVTTPAERAVVPSPDTRVAISGTAPAGTRVTIWNWHRKDRRVATEVVADERGTWSTVATLDNRDTGYALYVEYTRDGVTTAQTRTITVTGG